MKYWKIFVEIEFRNKILKWKFDIVLILYLRGYDLQVIYVFVT